MLVYDCLKHPPTAGRLQRQARMLLCMESAAHLPRLVRADFLRGFEVTATYRRDSDVPLLYAPGNTSLYAYGHALAALQDKRARATLVWVASNCAPARTALVQELMQHINVDSYGKCLHNAELSRQADTVFGSPKLPLFAQYPFALALENSIAEDYVTEKFYQPLLAGTVPVYLGAPNIRDYAPDPTSYIDLRDFSSVEALADRLKFLAGNAEAYARLHQWRRLPLPPRFLQQAGLGFNQGAFYGEQDMRQDPCRLCRAAHGAAARLSVAAAAAA